MLNIHQMYDFTWVGMKINEFMINLWFCTRYFVSTGTNLPEYLLSATFSVPTLFTNYFVSPSGKSIIVTIYQRYLYLPSQINIAIKNIDHVDF